MFIFLWSQAPSSMANTDRTGRWPGSPFSFGLQCRKLYRNALWSEAVTLKLNKFC